MSFKVDVYKSLNTMLELYIVAGDRGFRRCMRKEAERSIVDDIIKWTISNENTFYESDIIIKNINRLRVSGISIDMIKDILNEERLADFRRRNIYTGYETSNTDCMISNEEEAYTLDKVVIDYISNLV